MHVQIINPVGFKLYFESYQYEIDFYKDNVNLFWCFTTG